MEIAENDLQTVNTGSNVLFSDIIIPGNYSVLHRYGSGLVTLRGLPNGQGRARFKVFFNGNMAITSTVTTTSATPFQLSIAINGEAVQQATMISTTASNSIFQNVASETYIDVPTGCCAQVSVQNSGTVAIDVKNANFIVERVA